MPDTNQHILIKLYDSLRNCCNLLDQIRRDLYQDNTLDEDLKKDLSEDVATTVADVLIVLDKVWDQLASEGLI